MSGATVAIFPKWTNSIPTFALLSTTVGLVVVVAAFWAYATPAYWEVGYQPRQPVNYNHQLHAQQLGIDCRYCHSHVEESRIANVPSTSACMSCHTVTDDKSGYLKKAMSLGDAPSLHFASPDLAKLRQADATGDPVQWKRIHKLPDYVQFNHAAHLDAGVSCYSCHGRVDQMAVVYQQKSLSMSWCLDCHRDPAPHLIDTTLGDVTDLAWVEEQLAQPGYAEGIGAQLAARLRENSRRDPPTHCGACHY